MELVEIPIDKIHPDPSQPRKSFDENDIHEMAQSIKTEGIINAIEIDEKYIIITGERRWRAAKEAGLKTIPCKILKIARDERFMRQVIENIHHNTMNDWDTANAFKKIIGRQHRSHPNTHVTGNVDQGIRWLAAKTGKSRMYISEKLGLLEASAGFQKAIKQGLLTSTHLRVLERAPPEYKEAIERKLLANEFKTSEAGLEVIAALRRNPNKAEEILAKDYSKYPTKLGVGIAVSTISPRITDQIRLAIKPTERLGKMVTELVAWLDTNSPEGVGRHNIRRVVVNLNTVQVEIKKWLKDNK